MQTDLIEYLEESLRNKLNELDEIKNSSYKTCNKKIKKKLLGRDIERLRDKIKTLKKL